MKQNLLILFLSSLGLFSQQACASDALSSTNEEKLVYSLDIHEIAQASYFATTRKITFYTSKLEEYLTSIGSRINENSLSGDAEKISFEMILLTKSIFITHLLERTNTIIEQLQSRNQCLIDDIQNKEVLLKLEELNTRLLNYVTDKAAT
jgi:hypothetical protein